MPYVAVHSDGKHYVYTLAYPDGRVFYVGKGVGKRIDVHEQEAKGMLGKEKNPYKCNVIRKIWANNGQVLKTMLACFETAKDACLYEIALIFFMDGLTNIASGGEGSSMSEDHRQKISLGMKSAMRKEATQQVISDALSIEEGAWVLNVHGDTIRRMIKRGELPATKVGRQYRIPRATIEKKLAGDYEPEPVEQKPEGE